MKVDALRFLWGPNRHGPVSAMLATLAFERDDVAWLDAAERQTSLDTLLPVLHQAMPVTQESAQLADSAYILGAQHPAAALVLALTEVLIRDFCVQPLLGQVLGHDGHSLRLLVPADEPELAQVALSFAASVLQAAADLGRLPRQQVVERMHQRYRELREHLRGVGLNQSTLALARAAWARGIPAYRLVKPGQLLQLGQGAKRQRVMETATDRTSLVARNVSSDKFATAGLLRQQRLPTADPRTATSEAQAVAVASVIGYPVVVKPRSLGKGLGVHVDIRDEAALRAAFAEARSHRSGVIVERHVEGDDHRLLVVDGRLVAAARRVPAGVVGDGLRTVRELVAAANADPRRGVGFERLLVRIELDDEAGRYLSQQQLDAATVPVAGRWVRLRGTANISRGGTAVDVTDTVHPDNRRLAERAAAVVGLNITGIDFLVPDITRSWREQRCAVLEVNEIPGLRPHLVSNPGRDVAGPIVEHLFAEAPGGRVPTLGVSGRPGNTQVHATCRLSAGILAHAGLCVALSTAQGAWVGPDGVALGDVAGGRMARDLLLDPAVQAGVFELPPVQLARSGLHLDAVDVGMVLGVPDGAAGTGGGITRGQLAQAQTLVLRQARRLAVLNADDPQCLAQAEALLSPPLCLVSVQARHPAVQRHLQAGGLAVTLQGAGTGAVIRLQRGADILAEVPLTGRPDPTPALFAVAGAWGLGIDVQTLAAALAAFDQDAAGPAAPAA